MKEDSDERTPYINGPPSWNSDLFKEFKKIHLLGLYDIQVEFEKDPLLGELNQPKYRLNVKAEERDFYIDIYLPSWEAFVSQIDTIHAFRFKDFPLDVEPNKFSRSAPLLSRNVNSAILEDTSQEYKVISSIRLSDASITKAIRARLRRRIN